MNPFERLGLPPKLALDEGELKSRIEEASRRHHPDAGGEAETFEAVRKAAEVVGNPASRIRAAVEMTAGEPPGRGSIPGEVMDHFSAVAAVLERVTAFVDQRSKSRSGLGRAVLDAQLPALKGDLEGQGAQLAELEAALVARFGEFDERGWSSSLEEMSELSRGLVFLRKWREELKAAGGKLFEALLGG